MGVKPGYKKTEVGMIPEEWQTPTLGSLTVLMTNGFVGTATTHYANNENGILYIQGYNVEANSFNFHGIKYVTEDFHNKHMKSCLRCGDLLTVQTGEVGLTTIVPESLVGSNCHALIISRFDQKRVFPAYISYYLNSNPGRLRLRLIGTGTTMKHLNVGDMLQFKVPLPPTIAEQKAIAEVLSNADALIESLEQLIAKESHLKQGTMQKLLTGKQRLPGFAVCSKSKQTEIGVIPQDWEIHKLVDIGNVIRGASPRPKGDKKFYGGTIPRLMVEDVTRDGKIVFPQVDFLTEEGAKRSRPCKKGTLTIVCSGTVGIPSFLGVDACIHDGFLAIVGVRNNISVNYLYHQLSRLREQFDNTATHGGVFTNLTTAGVKEFQVPFPPNKAEQDAIDAVLSDMDTEITALETKIAKARQIKQGMMQELLTGRIRLV